MAALEQNFNQQLSQVKAQLEQLRAKQRDTALKSTREVSILKRLVANLSRSIDSDDSRLQNLLLSLRQDLEQQKDIEEVIPQLSVLEQMLKKYSQCEQKRHSSLDERVKQSGETLQRVPGLPAQIKRELRILMNFGNAQHKPIIDQAVKLLNIYEQSLKIITSNSRNITGHVDAIYNKELSEQLSQELQNLITELDFDGESGDILMDIRAKLLLEASIDNMLGLTIKILKLVIEGTHSERKTSQHFLGEINTALSAAISSHHGSVEQSETYLKQRSDMTGELEALTEKSRAALAEEEIDAEQLKETLNPVVKEFSALSERLRQAEIREKALLQRIQYSGSQLEVLQESTQDFCRRLEDQAQRMLLDPLTKVYNRSAFNERLEIEFQRWIRSQHSLRIALVDIDNFKSVNDSFGYLAGDKALKIIARTIRGTLSEGDMVARFSGEEFMLILTDYSDEKTVDLLEKIQYLISELPFKFRSKQLSITVSIACSKFEGSDTPEDILERAYRLNSEAKSNGTAQLTTA